MILITQNFDQCDQNGSDQIKSDTDHKKRVNWSYVSNKKLTIKFINNWTKCKNK